VDTRNLLSLSGVLMILGGALYYWGMGPAAPQLTDAGDQLPDYEVAGVESWQTDERGQLYRQIGATSAVHYRGSEDRTVVSQPVMTLYREGAPAWKVSAQKAVGTDQNREVQLSDQVHAERVAAGTVPVQVDMPTLNVHMQAQTMDTRDEVTVHAGKLGHLQSHGFDADLRADTMNLLNEVQGTYVTHP
jgi:LPS export ABC transporter protein LptC